MKAETKKNPDYTNSAIDLCNSAVVIELYGQWKEANDKYKELNMVLAEQNQVLMKSIEEQRGLIGEFQVKLMEAIEQYGSYQDVDAGEYAVKQARTSEVYIPERVRKNIPQYAEAVIEEIVNKEKVGGLLKGGLITQEQVDAISEKSESYAFIIK